jgi:hypothetical protein
MLNRRVRRFWNVQSFCKNWSPGRTWNILIELNFVLCLIINFCHQVVLPAVLYKHSHPVPGSNDFPPLKYTTSLLSHVSYILTTRMSSVHDTNVTRLNCAVCNLCPSFLRPTTHGRFSEFVFLPEMEHHKQTETCWSPYTCSVHQKHLTHISSLWRILRHIPFLMVASFFLAGATNYTSMDHAIWGRITLYS